MAQPGTPPDGPLTREQLREILNQWHWEPDSEHPGPFPGPLAARTSLTQWLDDVARRAHKRNIPREHWTNVVISWIAPTPRGIVERLLAYMETLSISQWLNMPNDHRANVILSWIFAATKGKVGFRERLLECMEKKRTMGELEQRRFWAWAPFCETFLEECENASEGKWMSTGLSAAKWAAALSVLGIPLLAMLGFTSGGVVAGSVAAGAQSMFYGGATGGLFSICQSIGARAAFPAAWNGVAGLVGGVRAYFDKGANGRVQGNIFGVENLGDIGDPVQPPASEGYLREQKRSCLYRCA